MNILTDTGLVQRFVSGWAGPGSRCVRSIVDPARRALLRRGHADVLRPGRGPAAAAGDRTVSVTGRCSLGDHVIGTVAASSLPGGAA